jgi:NTE family protein
MFTWITRRIRHVVGTFCIAIVASGCATFSPPLPVQYEPRMAPPSAFPAGSRPLALVLSGGAARGFAHIGVLEVLDREGIRPDLIVGSSAGSIVGALYASGLSAPSVDAALAEMGPATFRDVVLPNLGFFPGEMGVIKGEKFRAFLKERLRHEKIEDFPIRFAAVATDMGNGSIARFNSGDASVAVRASSAVPGIMTPVYLRGRFYGDGQIASPVPVMAARELGADIVIAVDVIYPAREAAMFTVIDVLFQAFTISTNRLREHELRSADMVIAPRIPPTSGQFGLGERERLVQIGRDAAMAALPRIWTLLHRARASEALDARE